MSRRPEVGIPARFKYQKVAYSHVEIDPGGSLLLTADPWSYLRACLTQKVAGTRGDNKAAYERASYYAELAEGFYVAAQSTSLPTQGTLVYYGMLNLVKCFLSVNRIPLEVQLEHHGLTLPMGTKTTVRVTTHATHGVNIFHEFARLLGKPVQGLADFELKEIASHIPEIHEIAFSLGHVAGAKRLFLPVQIAFLVNDTKNRLFTEIKYEKKNEARVRFQQFYAGSRAAYFRDDGEQEGWHVYRSHRRRAVSNANWTRIYRNVLKEYSEFDLASLLTHEGYRYYCDLGTPAFHHLSYSLMLAFFVGTIARYRPRATEEIMESDLRPLISEAVAVCPRQFLYHLASLITKSVCSIPHASLI